MFDTLFGAEVPLLVRFILAFVVVLALIGGAAWAVRRFGGDRLGSSSGRGHQPRLAVIDAAPVDARRRLVLIRRDNVEHLLMIGGPTDVVVEQNIVRASGAQLGAQRDAGMPRAPEPIARPAPEATQWPLQPEPPVPPRPARPPVAEEPVHWSVEPEPPPRPPREFRPPEPPRPEPSRTEQPPHRVDPLLGLADELSARPPQRQAPPPPEPPHAPAPEGPVAAPAHAEAPMPPAPPPPRETPPRDSQNRDSQNRDEGLADMAQRLEAALRRPVGTRNRPAQARPPAGRPAGPQQPAGPPPGGHPAAEPPHAAHEPEPASAHMSENQGAEAAPAPDPEAPPPRSESKPPQGRAFYDSLEQEMASLLGRPPGKE